MLKNQPTTHNLTNNSAINGLRGIACLTVLIFHALVQNQPAGLGALLTGTARLGVWLFFVLSAFLLTLRLLERGFGRTGLTDYVVARILRIIPLFILAVFLYRWAGIIGLTSWGEVVKAITFQSYYNHLWTIPIEFMFYGLLLPIVFIAIRLFRRSVVGGMAILTFAIIAAAVVFRPASPDEIVLWNYVACFGWGILAAFAVRFLPQPSPGLCYVLIVIGFGALVAVVLLLKSGLTGPPQHAISDKYSVFGAFWALAVYGAYSTERGISRILAWRPLSAFGLTIYSTYLFHWFPMHFIAPQPNAGWWAIPTSIAASIVLGIVGYQIAERRLQKLRRPVVTWLLSKMPVNDKLSARRL